MKKHTLFIVLLFCGIHITSAQKKDYFSFNELNTIHSETTKLLYELNAKMGLIGDVDEPIEDKEQFFIPDFVDMFYGGNSGESMIYNDLDPTEKTSKEFRPEEYAKNMTLFYSSFGLTSELKLETIKYGKIEFYQVGQYAFDIQIDKYMSGLYMDKNKVRKTETIQIRLVFDRQGAVLKDFKIAGIRKAIPDFEDFFIDLQWWKKLDENWKNTLKQAIDIKGEPKDKDLLYIRQLITQDGNGALIYDKQAFRLEHIVVDVVKQKHWWQMRKKQQTSYSGIVIEESSEAFTLQTEDGKRKFFPKDNFQISNRKTRQEYEHVVGQIKKANFNTTYRLTLDNGFSYPIKIVDKSEDNSQLKARIPNLGDKEITYTAYEIDQIILPIKRRGYYIEARVAPGFSLIEDKNIEIDNLKWETREGKPGAYTAGISFNYFINENIGIGVGCEFGNYETTYKLTPGLIIDSTQTSDAIAYNYPNDETFSYYNVYEISMGSYLKRSFHAISFPLQFKFLFADEPYKTGLFINLGVNLSMILNNNKASGAVMKYGYIQDEGVYFGRNVDPSPDTFGFITEENSQLSNRIGNYDYGFGIIGSAAIGACIPFQSGKHFLTISGKVSKSLNNISGGTHNDIFGEKISDSVSPLFFGLEACFNFKLK